MNRKTSTLAGTMFLVCIALGSMLLLGWIIAREGGLTAFFTPGFWGTILSTLIIAGVVLFFYPRALVSIRRKDPREITLDLDLPYKKAFDLAKRSFDSLPEGEVRSADAGKGIIEGWLPDNAFFGPGPAKITIMVQQTGRGISKVVIRGITPNPTHMPGPLLIDYCYSRNRRYVKWIHDFMVEPGNQGDGTLVKDKEILPPET